MASGEIYVNQQAIEEGASKVNTACDDVLAAIARMTQACENLIGSGWKGTAANAFSQTYYSVKTPLENQNQEIINSIRDSLKNALASFQQFDDSMKFQ